MCIVFDVCMSLCEDEEVWREGEGVKCAMFAGCCLLIQSTMTNDDDAFLGAEELNLCAWAVEMMSTDCGPSTSTWTLTRTNHVNQSQLTTATHTEARTQSHTRIHTHVNKHLNVSSDTPSLACASAVASTNYLWEIYLLYARDSPGRASTSRTTLDAQYRTLLNEHNLNSIEIYEMNVIRFRRTPTVPRCASTTGTLVQEM